MTPQELLKELETTSQRIDNIRVSERTLIKEFGEIVDNLEKQIEEAKQEKRPIIGPIECKERIEELELENEALKNEIMLKNSAIIVLQKNIQKGQQTDDKPSIRKRMSNFFRSTNSNNIE